MRYLQKLHTRTLVIIMALVVAPGVASLITTGVSSDAHGYSNRLVAAMRTATSIAPTSAKAELMAVALDKNVQHGKPEPLLEFSVIEYNGPTAPKPSTVNRLTAASVASKVEPVLMNRIFVHAISPHMSS